MLKSIPSLQPIPWGRVRYLWN